MEKGETALESLKSVLRHLEEYRKFAPTFCGICSD